MRAVINGFINMENVRYVLFFFHAQLGKHLNKEAMSTERNRQGSGGQDLGGCKQVLRVRERSMSVTPIEQPE